MRNMTIYGGEDSPTEGKYVRGRHFLVRVERRERGDMVLKNVDGFVKI